MLGVIKSENLTKYWTPLFKFIEVSKHVVLWIIFSADLFNQGLLRAVVRMDLFRNYRIKFLGTGMLRRNNARTIAE